MPRFIDCILLVLVISVFLASHVNSRICAPYVHFLRFIYSNNYLVSYVSLYKMCLSFHIISRICEPHPYYCYLLLRICLISYLSRVPSLWFMSHASPAISWFQCATCLCRHRCAFLASYTNSWVSVFANQQPQTNTSTIFTNTQDNLPPA